VGKRERKRRGKTVLIYSVPKCTTNSNPGLDKMRGRGRESPQLSWQIMGAKKGEGEGKKKKPVFTGLA